MNIIDLVRKGNVVRFYLGENGKQWGDDWNDAPYEHNAGEVYYEYVKSYKDVSYSFDSIVLEPCDGAENGNSKLTKEDMKNRKIPCLLIVPHYLWSKDNEYWGQGFDYWYGKVGVEQIYFGDEV